MPLRKTQFRAYNRKGRSIAENPFRREALKRRAEAFAKYRERLKATEAQRSATQTKHD